MTDKKKDAFQHEEDLRDLAKDLVDASLKGIMNIQNKRGHLAVNTPEYELFQSTLISSMVFLSKSGINPYENE